MNKDNICSHNNKYKNFINNNFNNNNYLTNKNYINNNNTINSLKNKCAGGIIIDPWNNINNYTKYNILIIKQRLGNNWGLPKGHCEEGEDLEYAAIREIKEETGIDFSELVEGIDYLKVYIPENNGYNLTNKKNIKRISFFIFVLLKKGNQIKKNKRDYNEIKDISWINVLRLRKLAEKNPPNFRCNRTLGNQTFNLLDEICAVTFNLLSEKKLIINQ